ncbi:transducin/WD40 repeat-like superfamily protein [Tasmannia lanceolata]|uniref:transducin/WD40 repeat-like superfamily protein n=1 Tax=Tasmannia lanceolata TaxID=3420 RepID=UPI004062916A
MEEMDTEESKNPSFKRLSIKNTIQTNFGDEYVFQIASSEDLSTLGVSLSSNTIKFYSPATGQYLGECRGHSGTINQISFSFPSSPNAIQSCSSDGTIRVWDTRSFNQVSLFRAGSSQEIFSFSVGGSTGNLLAAGCNAQILFWDWRNGKQVSCLEDSHVDDVTQVHFAPEHQNKLISASVDGLMCIFDTDGHINDDNHLESVMNVGTSIAKVGFFGDLNQKLWCLTQIETLSVWDWNDARKDADFHDARSLASDSWNLDHVDYFVDCHYSAADDRMWVIGGTNAGTLGYFPVNYNGLGSPEAILEGGHAGVVRTVLPASSTHVLPTRSRGIFGWTGGEDGRLCCWLSDESSEVSRSWISSSLVMKSPKTHKRNRHHPY